MSRPKIYSGGRREKAILRWIFPALLLLCLVLCGLFFLLRSWTVYDAEGAHILLPWSDAARAQNENDSESETI